MNNDLKRNLKELHKSLLVKDVGGADKAFQFIIRNEDVSGLLAGDISFYLPIDKDSVVLEVGSGLGLYTFNLSKKVKEVISIESDPYYAGFCRYRYTIEGGAIRFIESDTMDALNEISDKMFEAIVVNLPLKYINYEFLNIIFKLLKPSGVVYFSNIGSFFSLKHLKCRTMISKASFNSEINYYICYPNSKIPRFITPAKDVTSIDFMFNVLLAERGFLRLLYKVLPLKVTILGMKLFFRNYSMLIKK